MALFNRKSEAKKVIEAFNKLSDEDKENVRTQLVEKVEDLEKAEDEREVDKIEEDKAESPEVEDEKSEEVKEESEEIGEDVDKAEEEEKSEPEEIQEEETDKEEIEKAEEKKDDARDAHLEALISEFQAYKEKVDKLYAKLEELEEPEKQVGLGKQRSIEEAEDDEELSAYEYARKYAKY